MTTERSEEVAPSAEQSAEDGTPKVWQINLNGSSVKVEDLPLEVVDRIAKAHDESWYLVVNTPLAELTVAVELIAAAAEHLGIPAPAQPSVREVVDLFVLVPDTD